MHIAFLNPHGNFDSNKKRWSWHPDFGGQLVYVRSMALALASMGHQVDIVARQILDPDWPEFASPFDHYKDFLERKVVRIVRVPCGPDKFLPKESLWPHLVAEWVPNILSFYQQESMFPDVLSAHYADGGLSAVLLQARTGCSFVFTAHSLGAQKLDELKPTRQTLANLDAVYHFSQRLLAERLAISRTSRIIVRTRLEQQYQYAHPVYRDVVDVTDDQRFAVIPPGVDLAIFDRDIHRSNEEEAADVRARIDVALMHSLQPERLDMPMVIAASRLAPRKNYIGLLQAFCESDALQSKANLLMIVPGLNYWAQSTTVDCQVFDQMVDFIQSHDLMGRVATVSLEGQSELAIAYRYLAEKRSVFCLPALYEPFGLSLLEAMTAGLPVVATRNGGPSESLQKDGQQFGVLIDPTDPADIVRGLLDALGPNWALYHRVGRQRVHECYAWMRSAECYQQVLQQACLQAPPTQSLDLPACFKDPSVGSEALLQELAGFLKT